MILLEQAYQIVMSASKQMPSEKISFLNAVGRILASDVASDMNMPPFDKSAMDGYACRKQDIVNLLTMIETIPAGKTPEKTIEKNQCSKIMTGAPIPNGADCVLMVEHTKVNPDGTISFLDSDSKSNICYLGEDVRQNDVVINKGTLIKPAHVAIMASVGCVNPQVFKKPSVAVLSTGDEIIEPEFTPGISQIRNSNGYQLIAQIEQAGGKANYMGIVEDSEDATFNAITKAVNENDIVLLTGGVSMGDFDFVPKILKKAEVDILFQKIAVQPGKPTTFGVHKNALVFGLPGNPVSSFIQFELLVKPLIYKMMGYDHKPQGIYLPMDEDYHRKQTEREAWFPVIITETGSVKPVDYHGSAHINGLGPADEMFDKYNRRINYLRVSVTDRCNLRCTYCMPADGVKLLSHNEVLTFEEILDVVKAAVNLGVDKIRITGGEPLVRKGITGLVKMISEIPGVKDLAMTTNAILLEKFAFELADAGLQRINISLDTMNPEKFREITRGGNITDVFKGIDAAKKAGLTPVKINCVVKNSPDEEDAKAVADYCIRHGLDIRFIHLMELNTGKFSVVEGGEGGNCSTCNRLRLTANGKIMPCLFSDTEFDVRSLGSEQAIIKAIEHKPECGSVNNQHQFYNIGG